MKSISHSFISDNITKALNKKEKKPLGVGMGSSHSHTIAVDCLLVFSSHRLRLHDTHRRTLECR
jgi:hypothetical protein